MASLGDTAATCSTNLTFSTNSTLKTFSCSLVPSPISSLFVEGSVYMQCHTGLESGQQLSPGAAPAPTPAPGPSGSDASGNGSSSAAAGRRRRLQQVSPAPGPAASPPAGAYCQIGFEVVTPPVAVTCLASGCSISPGSSHVSCTHTSCVSPGTANCNSSK